MRSSMAFRYNTGNSVVFWCNTRNSVAFRYNTSNSVAFRYNTRNSVAFRQIREIAWHLCIIWEKAWHLSIIREIACHLGIIREIAWHLGTLGLKIYLVCGSLVAHMTMLLLRSLVSNLKPHAKVLISTSVSTIMSWPLNYRHGRSSTLWVWATKCWRWIRVKQAHD